jgi:Spy/CpxP family protein refolding chaperone
MSRTVRFVFAMLSLVLFSALAVNQAFAADDPPATPPTRGQGRGGRGGANLFANETVQKDLALTDEQKASIKKINDDFRSSLSGLSREDRRSKTTELRKGVEEKIDAVLDDKQKARIKEIRLQAQGPGALSTKEVADALKLSDDQVTKIKDLTKSLSDARREAFQGGGGGNSDAREKLAKLRTETNEKILALLTSDQKASFEKMQGAKIDLPAGGFGGGRNRGGNGN